MKKKKKYDLYFWIGAMAILTCSLAAATFLGALALGVIRLMNIF